MRAPEQGWVLACGALGLVALGGWSLAGLQHRRHRRQLAEVEARIARFGMFDEATGLLSGEGLAVTGQRIIEIARREADSVGACLIRVCCSGSGRLGDIDPDDLIVAAEAAEVVFRAGDAVGRLDDDTIMVVGKGPGFSPRTIHQRLATQMVQMSPPDDQPPEFVVGVAVLNPWDAGALPELRHLVEQDLEVRLRVHHG